MAVGQTSDPIKGGTTGAGLEDPMVGHPPKRRRSRRIGDVPAAVHRDSRKDRWFLSVIRTKLGARSDRGKCPQKVGITVFGRGTARCKGAASGMLFVR